MKVDEKELYVKARGIPRKDGHLDRSASHISNQGQLQGVGMKPTTQRTYTPTQRQKNNERSKRHREARPPEYSVWFSMRRRCRDANSNGYQNYGGRGVVVCPRWASFDNFYMDMGSRPSPQHQIDRIDNDGNYEPANCHWVLSAQNNQNRRSNKLTMAQAEAIRYQHNFGCVTYKDLCEMYGVTKGTVSEIVNNKIWIKEVA